MERDWNGIMFDNIGTKIQNVAKTIAWIEVALSFLAGIVIFFFGFVEIEYYWPLFFAAPIIIGIGCVAAWLSAIALYGFGKLIEDVSAIREQVAGSKKDNKPTQQPATTQVPKKVDTANLERQAVVPVYNEKSRRFECPACGCRVKKGQEKCLCFSVLDWTKIK